MPQKDITVTMRTSDGRDVPLEGLAHALTALDGYENTGHTQTHPVKIDLSHADILRYGRQLSRNVRIEAPALRRALLDADEPLEAKLRELIDDKQHHISQLAEDPDDDAFLGTAPTPEIALELGRILSEIKGLESQRRFLKLENRVALDKLALDNELLEMRINLGYEMRESTCVWYVNWSEGRKKLVRIDTREVVIDKPISPEERQLSMLDVDPDFMPDDVGDDA